MAQELLACRRVVAGSPRHRGRVETRRDETTPARPPTSPAPVVHFVPLVTSRLCVHPLSLPQVRLTVDDILASWDTLKPSFLGGHARFLAPPSSATSRVSTGQQTGEGVSLDAQKTRLRGLRPLANGLDLVAVFGDADLSAVPRAPRPPCRARRARGQQDLRPRPSPNSIASPAASKISRRARGPLLRLAFPPLALRLHRHARPRASRSPRPRRRQPVGQ